MEKLQKKLTDFIRSWNEANHMRDNVFVESEEFVGDKLFVLFKRTCDLCTAHVNAYSMLYIFQDNKAELRIHYEKFLYRQDSADWSKYLRRIKSVEDNKVICTTDNGSEKIIIY